jgi:hypothetical protein
MSLTETKQSDTTRCPANVLGLAHRVGSAALEAAVPAEKKKLSLTRTQRFGF